MPFINDYKSVFLSQVMKTGLWEVDTSFQQLFRWNRISRVGYEIVCNSSKEAVFWKKTKNSCEAASFWDFYQQTEKNAS